MDTNYTRKQLERLKESCKTAFPNERRLSILLRFPENSYTPEDLQFLERFLAPEIPENVRIQVLRLLCKFGNPVSKYLDTVGNNSSVLNHEIITIAESQNDPDTIIALASEDRANINLIVTALERMGKKEFLVSFLFSENEELVDLIQHLE